MVWEMKRLLKPDGLLLISVPGEKVHHPFIYPGLFTRQNFYEFLTLNGLQALEVKGWGQAPLLSHWSARVKDSASPVTKTLAGIVYYAGRKRNLLMRKRFGTPLSCAFTVNFLCRNDAQAASRAAQVAHQTTPH